MHEGHRKRLLDKVMKDCSVLSEHEILEALLFYAIPRRNTNETAKLLLDTCGGTIRSVLEADMDVLASIPGIGEHTAAYLKLLGTVVKDYHERKPERVKASSFNAIKEYVLSSFDDFDQEYFIVFFVNKKNEIIGSLKMTTNSHRYVDIDLTEISKRISILNPHGVLLAHNHPGGIAKPSSEDDAATEKIYCLLLLNNVALLDHLIVGANDCIYSYYKNGRLDRTKTLTLI